MSSKSARQWPRTVEFRSCPECQRHANFVIDGRTDERGIISTEGAMQRITDFVNQRRITHAQAHKLIARVIAAGLPASEAEAIALASLPELALGLVLIGGGIAAVLSLAGALLDGDEPAPGSRHSH